MKKYIIYVVLLIVGILLGWLIFSNSEGSSDQTSTHQHIEQSNNQKMWTCSMHPQIMQPEPGDCPICGMDLIPAESGAEGLAVNEIKMTENAMALANIQTTIVGSGTASNEDGMISLSGKIATNEENNSVQASYFDGRIESLNVNYEGQQVNRGQLLATIYAPNLVAAQQELITAASLKESQPALYKAVRNKLKNWKLSDNQIDAIESSGKVRDNFPIYATVSGTVSEVMAREGDYVKQGQPILKVSNLNSVWAEFDAYENQIANLKKGQKIKIVTNAYPNKVFDAIVSFIDPILNNSTRTVTVRATLKNPDDLFKPGMFVTGKLQGVAEINGEMLTVPATAVMWTGERSLVYVKTNPNEPVFEMRKVSIGNRNGENYTITDGLQNGEEIVTNGTFTVDAAAQLQGKKSMMNSEGRNVPTMPGMPGMKMDGDSQIKKGQIPTEKFLEGKAYDFRKETPKAFRQQLDNVIDAYLSLKDGLVAADKDVTKKYSSQLMASLQKLDGNLLKGDAIAFWNEKKDFLMEHAQLSQKAPTIAAKRENFIYLSQALIKIVEAFGSGDETLYVDYCPMANNNVGAYWLSNKKEIRNPYFGDAMLTCGSVEDEIE